MDWTWSRSVRSEARHDYIAKLAQICDQLADDGFQVELGGHSFLPEHGQNDLETCFEIARAAESTPRVDDNCDVHHLWRSYRSAAVVIGTRLHASIMSISVGTPTVVLAYQEKAEGVARTANGKLEVFRVDDFDVAEVIEAVESTSLEDAQALAQRLRSEISMVYVSQR
jgi:polysaccharide pyruvyl transferase WcaK-like protein